MHFRFAHTIFIIVNYVLQREIGLIQSKRHKCFYIGTLWSVKVSCLFIPQLKCKSLLNDNTRTFALRRTTFYRCCKMQISSCDHSRPAHGSYCMWHGGVSILLFGFSLVQVFYSIWCSGLEPGLCGYSLQGDAQKQGIQFITR